MLARTGRPTGRRPANRDIQIVKPRKILTTKSAVETLNKLFVSGLPMNVTNNDLYTLFGQFGPLSKCRIDYDNLGRSYGTAILEYKKEDNAQRALNDYNGAELDGKPIKIEFSRGHPKKDGNIREEDSQISNNSPAERRFNGVKRRGNFSKRRFDERRDQDRRPVEYLPRRNDSRPRYRSNRGNRFRRDSRDFRDNNQNQDRRDFRSENQRFRR